MKNVVLKEGTNQTLTLTPEQHVQFLQQQIQQKLQQQQQLQQQQSVAGIKALAESLQKAVDQSGQTTEQTSVTAQPIVFQTHIQPQICQVRKLFAFFLNYKYLFYILCQYLPISMWRYSVR